MKTTRSYREVRKRAASQQLANVASNERLDRAELPAALPAVGTRPGALGPTLNRGMFTSIRQDWETPIQLFRILDDEFGFELDVCATRHNSKCVRFFAPEIDGLAQRWRGV